MSILTAAAALLTAGTMLLSDTVTQAAPQHDRSSLLFLVNRQYMISDTFKPELKSARVPGQLKQLQPEAADALERMFADCKAETGAVLMTVSGYRSYAKQGTIYQRKLDSVGGSKKKADEYVARPGTSEHQSGLAMDIGQKNTVNLTEAFAQTTGGQWLREHAADYGFILRYDKGKEEITGYLYEPWHFRYVGLDHAKKITDGQYSLEEYLSLFRAETIAAILEKTDEE